MVREITGSYASLLLDNENREWIGMNRRKTLSTYTKHAYHDGHSAMQKMMFRNAHVAEAANCNEPCEMDRWP